MAGRKTFEYRVKIRDFQIGDILVLQECILPNTYTGEEAYFQVSYLLDGGSFGVPHEHCIMSIVPARWAAMSLRKAAQNLCEMCLVEYPKPTDYSPFWEHAGRTCQAYEVYNMLPYIQAILK